MPPNFVYVHMRVAVLLLVALFLSAGCMRIVGQASSGAGLHDINGKSAKPKLNKSDAEWKKLLTPNQYAILRQADTEEAFDNEYFDNHKPGVYACAACGQKLFSSDAKFESGTGWPSFWQPIDKHAVLYRTDKSFGMERTEVVCSNCGGHLGHLFDDGPKPTGLRYCMNSGAMKFIPATKASSVKPAKGRPQK